MIDKYFTCFTSELSSILSISFIIINHKNMQDFQLFFTVVCVFILMFFVVVFFFSNNIHIVNTTRTSYFFSLKKKKLVFDICAPFFVCISISIAFMWTNLLRVYFAQFLKISLKNEMRITFCPWISAALITHICQISQFPLLEWSLWVAMEKNRKNG